MYRDISGNKDKETSWDRLYVGDSFVKFLSCCLVIHLKIPKNEIKNHGPTGGLGVFWTPLNDGTSLPVSGPTKTVDY